MLHEIVIEHKQGHLKGDRSYCWVSCKGCRWFYEPTTYEQRHADPLLDLLKYYYWMHILDALQCRSNHKGNSETLLP